MRVVPWSLTKSASGCWALGGGQGLQTELLGGNVHLSEAFESPAEEGLAERNLKP